MYFPVILAITGIVLLTAGIIYQSFVLPAGYNDLPDNNKFHRIKMLFQKLERLLAPSKDSTLFKYLENVSDKLDVDTAASRLWLYKLACFLGTFMLLVMISATNTQILKQSLMGTWWQENSYTYTITKEEYKYNASIYKKVISDIGERNLKKLNTEEKKKAVARELNKGRNSKEDLSGKADALLSAFQNVQKVNSIDIKLLLTCIIAFFLPEIILIIRKLIVGTKYRREAIMLENIFGLLGSIPEYKTNLVLKDMAHATKIFSRQLNHAATLFYTDKNRAFDYLKKSIRERSFTRLVDTIRVYSTVDKKLALTILERNIKEQEEQLLLSAEEDMDIVDVLAFMSVVPILYEVANLMLNPMMDLVFKAFNFI